MNAILLPIRPVYVQKIISGEKKYEYRRRICRRKIDIIYIYATHPVKKVVAEVEVLGTVEGGRDEVWKQTERFSGIEKSFFDEYFSGMDKAGAYCLGKVTVYETAKNLEEFDLGRAPQSYAYVQCTKQN